MREETVCLCISVDVLHVHLYALPLIALHSSIVPIQTDPRRACRASRCHSSQGVGRWIALPLAPVSGRRLCHTEDECTSKDIEHMTRIETTVVVGSDGVSANLALPIPVAPGRHSAVVIIDDHAESADPVAWAARTYGSVTDETFARPEGLPFEVRESLE